MNTDEIINQYKNGKSSLQLARDFNTSKQTILRILKKNKIQRRQLSNALRKFSLDDSFFERIDTEDKAYWLGFLLADGNICSTGRYGKSKTLRIALQIRDINHLEKFKSSLKSNHPVKVFKRWNRKTQKNYESAWLCITSLKMATTLEKLGWQQFKSDGDCSILNVVPSKLQKSLVRGLIDGDGCLNKECFIFIDLHKEVSEWVAKFIKEKVGIQLSPKGLRHPSKAWAIQYSGRRRIQKIVKFLYENSTVSLDRKLERAYIICKDAECRIPKTPYMIN